LRVLEIQNLSVGYGARLVLQDFQLQVGRGEIAAIIGPNGCGKSTLLNCVAGLLAPHKGTIRLDGDDAATLSPRERARRVALLPQGNEGGENLTTEDMAMLGRTPHLGAYGAPSERDYEIVQSALAAAGVEDFRGRKVGELSGGERQRVILARSLAQGARVLLLDEPTSHLDLHHQYETLDAVQKIARREKLALVLVLHQINLAAAVADMMVLLGSDGKICASGAPQSVVTAQNLQAVYNVPLEVTLHPRSGRPHARADWVFDVQNLAEK